MSIARYLPRFAGWLALLWLLPTFASVRLPMDTRLWPLTAHTQYWIDPSGQTMPPAVFQAPFQAIGNPNFGNRWGALWLRLAIDNPGPPAERVLRVGPAMLKQVDLWQAGAGTVSHQAGGLAVPQSHRALPGRCSLFRMTLPSGSSVWYLRLASPSKLSPDLTLGGEAAFRREARIADMHSALMFGSLLMTALMSLLYALWMHEWVWLCFGLGVFAYVGYQACYEGLAAEWLWPDHTLWSLTALPWTAALTQGLLATFLIAFIPRTSLNRAWRLMWALPLTTALGLGMVFLVDYRYGMPVIEAVGIACSVILPLFSLVAWRGGFHPAGYALASFGLIYAVTLLRVGTLFGWWPNAYRADLWLMPLAGVVASGLLLLAVLEHVRILRATQSRSLVELAEARDIAQRANRAKSLFLARVSHDLRTPLQALTGYLNLARRERPSGAVGRYLEIIDNSGRSMLALIDELLQFVRGEEGRLELHAKPIFLHALIQQIAAQGEILAREQGNRFVLDLALSIPVANIDGERIESILVNLLGNACRMTVNGTVTLSVAGREANGMADLRFAVCDTGPGIALEDHERIFLAFEHGRTGAHYTGLGLAIARQLVRLMGGELRVESSLGQGAAFYFDVRAALAAEADVVPPTSFYLPSGYAGPVRTLLVVDDIEEIRILLEDILTGMGFDVMMATGVQDALHLARETAFDAAIVDQYLLDGTGWQILDGLKAGMPHRPVILLSATPAEPPNDRESTVTFDAHLLKPLHIDELTKVLSERLGLVWAAQGMAPAPAPREPKTGPMTAEDLATLRQAAYEGSLFEVEDWIEQWRHRPEEQEFLQQLELLLAKSRLPIITAMVDRRLSSSPSPKE